MLIYIIFLDRICHLYYTSNFAIYSLIEISEWVSNPGAVKQKKKERSTTSLPKFKATSLKLWCHRVRKM